MAAGLAAALSATRTRSIAWAIPMPTLTPTSPADAQWIGMATMGPTICPRCQSMTRSSADAEPCITAAVA